MPDDLDDKTIPKLPLIPRTKKAKSREDRVAAAQRAAAVRREATAAREAVPTDDWIEVLLVDDEGFPLSGERCRITTPDGSAQDYYTGVDGLIRIDGLNPGDCLIAFPDLDTDSAPGLGASGPSAADARQETADSTEEGQRGAGAGAAGEDAADRNWIELILIDEDDEPVANTQCRIQPQGGAAQECSTDSQGRIRVEGITPGECVITFPDVENVQLL